MVLLSCTVGVALGTNLLKNRHCFAPVFIGVLDVYGPGWNGSALYIIRLHASRMFADRPQLMLLNRMMKSLSAIYDALYIMNVSNSRTFLCLWQ